MGNNVNDWLTFKGSNTRNREIETSFTPPLEVLWSFDPEVEIFSSPVVCKGKVYFGAHNKKVYCLDAKTGRKVWEYETDGKVTCSPAVSEDKLVIGSEDKNIYCLNRESGEVLWKVSTEGIVSACPAIEETKVYVNSCDDYLYCVSLQDGKELWKSETGWDHWAAPTLYLDYIYTIGLGNKLLCLNKNSGKKIWEVERGTDQGGFSRSCPVIENDRLYICGEFGEKENKIKCLNPKNEDKYWEIDIQQDSYGFGATMAVSNKLIFYGTINGFLGGVKDIGDMAINLWIPLPILIGWWIISSPLVINGYVYITTNQGMLHIFEENSGKRVFNLMIDRESNGSPSTPAFYDDKLYIGTSWKGLLCFESAKKKGDELNL